MTDQERNDLALCGPKARPTDLVMHKVRQFLHSFDAEESHSGHVTRLALSLLDQLQAVHRLDDRGRLILECAGTLHDIGWLKGRRGHHKESMRMILGAGDMGLTQREQLIVANIARYHRKSLPDERHANYRRLADQDKALVQVLAGILRLADGMDCQHLGRVRALAVRATARQVTLTCETSGDARAEMRSARAKSDLLKAALHRRIVLRWPVERSSRKMEPGVILTHP